VLRLKLHLKMTADIEMVIEAKLPQEKLNKRKTLILK